MSDSSGDEDLSRFKNVIDVSFINSINKSQGTAKHESNEKELPKKSERYLETASHYNDVKVPEEMQRQIGAKISAIINKKIEFVDNTANGVKKRKIKGGVKLFKTSEDYLNCEEVKDTYTEVHNQESKKMKKKRRQIEDDNVDEEDKITSAVVSGEYVLSKEETKCWKSRRKEKLFKYKSNGKSKVLTAVE